MTKNVAADILQEAFQMATGRVVGTHEFWVGIVDLLSEAAIEKLGTLIPRELEEDD